MEPKELSPEEKALEDELDNYEDYEIEEDEEDLFLKRWEGDDS